MPGNFSIMLAIIKFSCWVQTFWEGVFVQILLGLFCDKFTLLGFSLAPLGLASEIFFWWDQAMLSLGSVPYPRSQESQTYCQPWGSTRHYQLSPFQVVLQLQEVSVQTCAEQNPADYVKGTLCKSL